MLVLAGKTSSINAQLSGSPSVQMRQLAANHLQQHAKSLTGRSLCAPENANSMATTIHKLHKDETESSQQL
jgi:hypothetical protein